MDGYEQITFSRLSPSSIKSPLPTVAARLFVPLSANDNHLVAQLDHNDNHTRITYHSNGLPDTVYDSAGRRHQLDFIDVSLTQTDPDFIPAQQSGAFTG